METRLYEADAYGSVPDMDTLTSSGYPTNGNPALGLAATKPGAAWFYGLSEELRNAIVNAGLTPSNSDLTQLFKAMCSWQCFPTGAVMPWVAKISIPDNWLIMNGQSVSKTTYANLNALINSDGSLDDSGDNTKLIIPDMTGRVWQGCSSYSDVLVAKESGLPNIQGASGGHIDIGSDGMFQGGGAMLLNSATALVSPSMGSLSSNTIYQFTFDASRWNALYGSSTTVQPKSRQALMIIRA